MRVRDLLPKASPDRVGSLTYEARRFASVLAGLASLAVFAAWEGREPWRDVGGLAVALYALSFILGWWGNRIEPYRPKRMQRAVLNTAGWGAAGFAIYFIFSAFDSAS